METTNHQAQQNVCFRIKSGLAPMTTLQLLRNDLELLKKQLKQLFNQVPSLCEHSPLILDLEALKTNQSSIDFTSIGSLCSNYGLTLVAIRDGNPEQKKTAIQAGLAWLPVQRRKPNIDEKTGIVVSLTQGSVPKPIKKSNSIEYIQSPVRSGQQVHSTGDLVVLAAVNAGAELLAEGNIYVYAPLRGRALAGIQGNKKARIFCTELNAELVSISGCYKLAEDMESITPGKAVQISLEEDRLQFKQF